MASSRRASKWPSNAEVKYNPANWDVGPNPKPFSTSDDDVRSDIADIEGDLVLHKGRPNPPDHELKDWSGGFAPPPVDWNDRTQYVPSERLEVINAWRDLVSEKASGAGAGDFQSPQETLVPRNSGRAGDCEICPGEWVLHTVGELKLGAWWKKHKAELKEMDGEDRWWFDGDDIDPFWERHIFPENERLYPLKVSDVGVDSKDQFSQQNRSQNATRAIEDAVLRIARRKALIRREREERRQFKYDQKNAPPLITEHTPKVNLYLRMVEERDVPQVSDILNEAIAETVSIPEMRRLNHATMNERRLDINEACLPFLVAVDRSSKSLKQQGSSFAELNMEPIIGVAFADECSSRIDMFRFSVELECYVRKEYQGKRVASALLDKAVSILDPFFMGFGGYDFVGHDVGGKRMVKSILAQVHVASDDTEKMAWCEPWLGKMGFEKKGELHGNGRKLGKIVDTFMFWKTTGNDVPAHVMI